MIAEIVMLGGALLILLAGIGVLRFQDIMARMHALSKASTLGMVLVVAGGALGLEDSNDSTFALLAAAVQIITAPVGANLIARSTYLARRIPLELDDVDELAPRLRAQAEAHDDVLPPGAGT